MVLHDIHAMDYLTPPDPDDTWDAFEDRFNEECLAADERRKYNIENPKNHEQQDTLEAVH